MNTKKPIIKSFIELIDEVQDTHMIKKPGESAIKLKLTPNEKIKFALEYYNAIGNISFIKILEMIYKTDVEARKKVIRFMSQHNLFKPYPDTLAEYQSKVSLSMINDQRIQSQNMKSLKKEYNYQNWLEPFDEEAMFKQTKTKSPLYHIFMDKNGNPVRFDKNKTLEIKAAIIDLEITPARCLVESAYRHVANGTFDQYLDDIYNQNQLIKGGKAHV